MSKPQPGDFFGPPDDAPLRQWRLPAEMPVPTQVSTDHPVQPEPGKCQICQSFALLEQRWPSTLPGRFAELCAECRKLGDMEIARRLPPWRRDGASV